MFKVKRYSFFLACFIITISHLQAQSINYFIDAVNGIDNNNGTSITTPWKNLTKLYTLTISEGSTINLKTGSVWVGQQLKFLGSGTATKPIIVDDYGVGPKPILHGNGITTANQGVVYLYNQQYIEINNLEITNTPNTPNDADFFVGLFVSGAGNLNPLGADRRGVMVAISKYGTANHIYLKNLDVHHVKGQLGSGSSSVNGAIPKRTGGIYFAVLSTLEQTTSKSRFNDVLIDGCNINYCENTGLAFDNEWSVFYPGGNEYADWYSRRFSNVKVRNNNIHHIGKNAMIIRCTDETGLIEKNICYETAVGTTGNTMFTARAKGTVFQYNEGYFNRSTTQRVNPGNIDGSMYDPDFGSVGIIFQYSYSHDNSEGIYWGCNTRGVNNNTTGIPDPEDVGCTLRYCVSQNDLGSLVFFNYATAGNEIYNNVFYIKSGLSPKIIHENSGNNVTYNFYNNIIYNVSSAASGARYSFGSGTGVQTRNINYNVFFGNKPATEPTDANKIDVNPSFVNPGVGGFGLNTLNGYQLQAGSNCINSGIFLTNTATKDFFGYNLPTNGSGLNLSRGIYEYTSALPVQLIAFNATLLGSNVQLKWQTANEINNAGFTIQKSVDGIVFFDLAFVKAKQVASVASITAYAYNDANPTAGTNYYRLLQIDKDQKTTLSKVVAVQYAFLTKPVVTVFPNPIQNNTINLRCLSLPEGDYHVEIVSAAGNKIYAQKIKYVGAGNFKMSPVALTTKGILILTIYNKKMEKVITPIIFQ